MNQSTRRYSPFLVWVTSVIFVVALAVLLTPNFVGGGPSKTGLIIGNLFTLVGAEQQWSLTHGGTNASVLTKDDVAPFLGRDTNAEGWVNSVADERYTLKPAVMRAEVQLTRVVEKWPTGTIFVLGLNGTDYYRKTILPGQPR